MKLFYNTFTMISLGGALGSLSRFYLSIFIDACALQWEGVFNEKTNSAASLEQALTPALEIGIIPEVSTEAALQLVSLNPSLALFFSVFPLAVLLINMLGSLMLGSFITYIQYMEKNTIQLRNLFVISFLGSFTTFSTFIIDTIKGILPFILQSTPLLEIIPNFKKIMYPLEIISPFYEGEILASHLFLFSAANVFLNLTLCIMCVWIGHGFIKKFYAIKINSFNKSKNKNRNKNKNKPH